MDIGVIHCLISLQKLLQSFWLDAARVDKDNPKVNDRL